MIRTYRLATILFFGSAFLLYVLQFWYRYKFRDADEPPPPRQLSDNFPQASIYFNSRLPEVHVQENTTLFIGFSQNWFLLQQCVVSYIAAGWPPDDIYVIDNTGTFLSNRHKRLSINNPSYLDYERLETVLGVNVITTPAELSFSQLQNFFLSEAIDRHWSYYFWSHTDAVALSANTSLYSEAVADLRKALQDADSWGTRLYAYDHLALVSVRALEAVGGWDVRIPFYPSDCDMYSRLEMAGYTNPSLFIGHIFDVASSVDDLAVFFNLGSVGSPTYDALEKQLSGMMAYKNGLDKERNTWQAWQTGGVGEPYHYDREGTRRAHAQRIAFGRQIYIMKWGTQECRLLNLGVTMQDMWARNF